jgi:hypothetical protein
MRETENFSGDHVISKHIWLTRRSDLLEKPSQRFGKWFYQSLLFILYSLVGQFLVCCSARSIVSHFFLPLFSESFSSLHSSPWWWRQYAPLKCRSTSTWLHGSTSQKTLNFILAAMRTWNLTRCSEDDIPGIQSSYWPLSKLEIE